MSPLKRCYQLTVATSFIWTPCRLFKVSYYYITSLYIEMCTSASISMYTNTHINVWLHVSKTIVLIHGWSSAWLKPSFRSFSSFTLEPSDYFFNIKYNNRLIFTLALIKACSCNIFWYNEKHHISSLSAWDLWGKNHFSCSKN